LAVRLRLRWYHLCRPQFDGYGFAPLSDELTVASRTSCRTGRALDDKYRWTNIDDAAASALWGALEADAEAAVRAGVEAARLDCYWRAVPALSYVNPGAPIRDTKLPLAALLRDVRFGNSSP
jgi:hypothetical protein